MGGTTVWQIANITAQNSAVTTTVKLGNILKASTVNDLAGRVTDKWLSYIYGVPIRSMTFSYNPATGNMTGRTGMTDGNETFTYDNLDRLTGIRYGSNATHDISYAPNGNITTQTDIGRYYYEGSKPHAVTSVDNTRGRIPTSQLDTQYNVFGKISTIHDYGDDEYRMVFTYGPDNERWRTRLYKDNSTLQRTTNYLGDYEEIVEGGTTRRLYYIGGDVLYKKQTSCPDSIFYLFTDHLGSVVAIVDQSGNEKFSATYDAWGNQTVTRNALKFHRGYTGHEMLPEFGIINMNGRLYDPQIGRFLSTDNYVQEPWNSQNFNRYSYCLNNPLKYTDPSGELFGIDDIISIVAMAYIGGIMANVSHCDNTNSNPFNPGNWNWSSTGTYLGLAGGVLNGLGISTNVPGIITNGAIHASANVVVNGITNLSDHCGFFENWGLSATTGFLEGAVGGYIESKRNGLNYWWGNEVKYNRTQWSFINTDKPDFVIKMMHTNPITYNENDCVAATMTEIENEIGVPVLTMIFPKWLAIIVFRKAL